MKSAPRTLLAAPFLALLPGLSFAQGLSVVSMVPAAGNQVADPETRVELEFDRALDPLSLPPNTNDFWIFGKYSGVASGSLSLADADRRLVFQPDAPFAVGETVHILCSSALRAADGTTLRAAGWTGAFRIGSKRAPNLVFNEVQRLSGRTNPGVSVRIYGASMADLNEDGWIDIALVNEDSSDVRVLPNRADGTGLYDLFSTPTPTGAVPSPNETADFNRDGHMDMCTANTQDTTVSVLLGDGTGGFSSSVEYSAGSNPRGIAVLDVDGDGDQDIVNTNFGSNNLSLLLNDGNGVFGAATFIEGGGNGEFALASDDLDRDGISDLVVGSRTGQRVTVLLGNGDGSFSLHDTEDSVGATWQLSTGDVNGDGFTDVVTANSFSNSSSVLFGDGSGNLSAPQVQFSAAFTTAIDLGDLDGDGDLDRVLSNFSDRCWQIWENQGNGTFVLRREFFSSTNPGCAAMLDIDKDRDLDLVLLDETGDEVRILDNFTGGTTYCYGDGSSAACPCGNGTLAGADRSCANSSGAGALIAASGSTSVLGDLELCVLGLPPGRPGLLFAGTTQPMAPFGDALRCVGGSITRFPVGFASAAGSFSQGGIAARVGASSGDTRHFQGWFRDAGGPCGNGFTLSAGYSVVFTP